MEGGLITTGDTHHSIVIKCKYSPNAIDVAFILSTAAYKYWRDTVIDSEVYLFWSMIIVDIRIKNVRVKSKVIK